MSTIEVTKDTDRLKTQESYRQRAISADSERKPEKTSRLLSVHSPFCFVSWNVLLLWQLIGASQDLIIIHLCGFVYNLLSSGRSEMERERKWGWRANTKRWEKRIDFYCGHFSPFLWLRWSFLWQTVVSPHQHCVIISTEIIICLRLTLLANHSQQTTTGHTTT